MDNDVSSVTPKTTRKGRQRRRLIGGAGAVLLVLVGVAVGGTWQHSKAGTSGALGVHACPVIDPTTHLPSIAPVAEVNWANCNLTGADLRGAYLFMAALNGATLSGANLTDAVLTGAVLTGVQSGAIVGTVTLPTGWIIVDGYLVGPGANLTSALLTGALLTGVDLTGANLKGATLTGATMTGVIYSYTICPNGTFSSNRTPQSCTGQGGGL